jgi:hypothetical protein
MYHNVRGKGKAAACVVASERTMAVARAMVARKAANMDGQRQVETNTLEAAVTTLRQSWEVYMQDPKVYAEKLAAEARTWHVKQAREHLLDNDAFGPSGRHGKWASQGPTEAQVHVIVEADILYNAQAFYRVVPRPH